MPFCSKCGNQVDPADGFCGRCGARQPRPSGAPPVSPVPPASARVAADPLGSVNPRTASILCYVPGIGWIAAIIVLASEKFRRDPLVRFHAFQGLYLFVAWLIDDWVIRPMFSGMSGFRFHHLIQLALLVMSVFMMVKAAHNEAYQLPLFGELAQRSVAED